jgi:hypothetical protein
MMELKTISRLPADVAQALAEYYLDLGGQLLRRAREARTSADERRRLRDRRDGYARIWEDIEAQKAAGVAYEAALVAVAQRLNLTPDAVHDAYAAADRRRGEHKRRLRDLEIARRAAAGERYEQIAPAVGLKNPQSVGRIVRRLARAGALALPRPPLRRLAYVSASPKESNP